MSRLEWLDRLTFREIENINKVDFSCNQLQTLLVNVCEQEESLKTKHLFLYIDLPQFDFPLVFNEKVGGFPCTTIEAMKIVIYCRSGI